MELSQLYRLAIDSGIAKDPRKETGLKKEIQRLKKTNGGLDPDYPKNPYPDTRILNGNLNTQVKRILVGIDIEAAELLLADRLRQKMRLDLVIAHHPQGKARAQFYEVMQMQINMLESLGVKQDLAQILLDERKQEVARRVSVVNHNRAVDVAHILGIPFVCMHTPSDNFAYCFVDKLIRENRPDNLRDILDILENVPEYRMARKENSPPRIILGSPRRRVGKVCVEMTGGTEGHKKVYDKLYKLGIRTLVCMHLSEEHFSEVKDKSLNVIIAGHMASDTLGMNLLLDEIEKGAKEELGVIDCSGFRRVRHYVR